MEILNIYRKYFSIGFFFSLGIVLSAYLMLSTKHGMDVTVISGIISALGSLIGGLLGGLVAFAVALGQINSSKKSEKDKYTIYKNNILKLISNEIEHNQKILESIVKYTEKRDEYSTILEDEIWNHSKYDITGMVSGETFFIMSEFYRDIKDMKQKVLEEYREGNINYKTRVKTAKKIISTLGKE